MPEISFSATSLMVPGEQVGLGSVSLTENPPNCVSGILIEKADGQTLCGSAFHVAPGLAITAKHVISDHFASDEPIFEDVFTLLDWTHVPVPIERWKIQKINFSKSSDVAIISLRSISSEDFTQKFVRLTTRIPQTSEKVVALGLRQISQAKDYKNGEFNKFANRFPILEVFPNGRDRVVLPELSFHGSGITVGGMSGGPVVDQNGHVFGVVSSGFKFSDSEGVTGISSIIPSFVRRIQSTFPENDGKYYRFLEYPHLEIIGRHHFQYCEFDGKWGLQPWKD